MTQRSQRARGAREFRSPQREGRRPAARKAVGLIGVLFLTVTGAAPKSAMLGNVPFAAGFGNGIYVPAAFLLATIVLTIFSVGYAAMAQKSRPSGASTPSSAWVLGAMSAWRRASLRWRPIACLKHRSPAFSPFSEIPGSRHTSAINIPWIYLSFFMIVLISVLAYQDVQISVKVLGAALVFEVIMLVDLRRWRVCRDGHAELMSNL